MPKLLKILLNISILIFLSTEVIASPSDGSKLALEKFNDWNKKLSKEGLLIHKMKIDPSFTEVKNIPKSLGIDERFDGKDRFFKFATDSYGSILYLWYYPELEGEAPVVTCDVSDNSADSVSENMNDYVCSIINDEDNYNKNSINFAKVEEYKNKFSKSLNCKAKPKFYFGLTKHPRFDKWLDSIDNKYQN